MLCFLPGKLYESHRFAIPACGVFRLVSALTLGELATVNGHLFAILDGKLGIFWPRPGFHGSAPVWGSDRIFIGATGTALELYEGEFKDWSIAR